MTDAPTLTDVPQSMTVADLSSLMQGTDSPVLLDVREQWERDIASLAGSMHVPLGEVIQRMAELPLDRHIVVLCHHGGRSARATSWLRQNGYHATNLEGGIDSWSSEIDRDIPRY